MADALSTIPGCQTSAYVLTNPTPPHLCVIRGDTAYDLAMANGVQTRELNVRAYVADTSDQGAPMLLDQFVDPDSDRSVKAALEADSTLGGVVSDLHVSGASGEQVYVTDGRGPLLGSEFQVTVWL